MKPPPTHYQLLTNFGVGQEKEYFIEQLSMLLGAGMPVVTALSAIKKEIKSGRLKKIISDVSARIEAGSSISAALDWAGIFSQSTISLIRVGEQSGRLSENLKVVASDQQKEREFRSKVSSAMIYPLFVFGLTIAVGVSIAWFILPRLATVFAQLRITLPLITRILIGVGTFLGLYGYIAIPSLFIFCLLAGFLMFVYSKTNFIGQAILFSIGPISRLLMELELSRFGSLLGNLLEAGLPILDSLNSLAQSTTLYRYKKFYVHLHDRIAEGNSFGKSFQLYAHVGRLIPVPVQQLVVSGEQSGNLPATLQKIGEMYEAKTETTTKNISVLLEPILLVIVWLGVLAVAVAVILPLYSLLGGINPPPPVQTPSPPAEKIISPTPTQAPVVIVKRLKILPTTTGFLNIRKNPDLTSPVVGKATPGASYEYLAVQQNWYELVVASASAGWVFGDYVELVSSE